MPKSSPSKPSPLEELERLGFTPEQIAEIADLNDLAPLNCPAAEFSGVVDRQSEAERENLKDWVRSCEAIRAAVLHRPLNTVEVFTLRSVIEAAWHFRGTAAEVLIDGPSFPESIRGEWADRYFLRELPALIFRAARLAGTGFNLPSTANGWDLVRLFKDADPFWLSLEAASPAANDKPGPEKFRRKDAKANYFKVWDYVLKPGNSGKNHLEVERAIGVDDEAVKRIRTETRRPTAEEITEHKRIDSKRR